MSSRLNLAFFAFAVAVMMACGSSQDADPLDAGSDSGPSEGVCCPITVSPGCSPGSGYYGGWAGDRDACEQRAAMDGRPFERVTDERGCEVLREASTGCCGCVSDAGARDGGSSARDGATPPDGGTNACSGLLEAACAAAADCVPTYDDRCCSVCDPDGCADCTEVAYFACLPEEIGCGEGACSVPGDGLCTGARPDCSDAEVTSETTCSKAGCVPAFAAGAEPGRGICVPIHGEICTARCRRVAPSCAEGTVPEGDGFCYTDRCIPRAVCAL